MSYTTTDTTLDGMYRTTNSKGQRMDDLNSDQIHKAAVHTKDAGECRHATSPHMRRAAVRLNGSLAVVWSTGDWEQQNRADRQVLVYAGDRCLLTATPEALEAEGAWLKASEYDATVRVAIDDLWQEAANVPIWHALGARIPKRVVGYANCVTEKHRGYHGVYRVTNKKGSEWHARHKGTFGSARHTSNLGKKVENNTHTTNLGTFGTIQEAALAYDKEHREILKCAGYRDPRLKAHELNYPNDPQPTADTDAARAELINMLSRRPDPRLIEGNPMPDRAPDPPPTANNAPTYSTVLGIADDGR